MIRRWKFTVSMIGGGIMTCYLTSEADVKKTMDHFYMCMETQLPFRMSNGAGGMDAIINPAHIIRGWMETDNV